MIIYFNFNWCVRKKLGAADERDIKLTSLWNQMSSSAFISQLAWTNFSEKSGQKRSSWKSCIKKATRWNGNRSTKLGHTELGCREITAGEREYVTFGCSKSGAIVSVCRQRWSVVEVLGRAGGCIQPTSIQKCVPRRTDAVLKAKCDHSK